jgi:hypothetical protein
VLEIEKRRKEKNCKRLGWVQPNSSSAWHTGLSGAPGWSPVNMPLLEKVWRRTAIIHRTVRWYTGLSGEPTVANATAGRAICGRRVTAPMIGCGHRTVSGAPTGPELQRSSMPEKEGDRHRTGYSDCPAVHRSVRCTT